MTKTGNGKRIAAFIIDLLIVVLINKVVIQGILELPKIPFIAVIIFIIYSFLMEGSKYRATLGKMALGLEVVDAEENRISMKTAIIRGLIRGISVPIKALFLIPFAISVYFAFFTEAKQALHDKAAKTFVMESHK